MQPYRHKKIFTRSADSPKKRIKEYFFYYTLIFIFICLIAFFPFILERRCLVWKIDGMPQYLLWLKYTGKYLRNMIVQFLHGNFQLPMYDFTIGMGGDVRSFLKMEPIGFLGIFLFGNFFDWEYYSLLTFLRIYLIGVSFSCYGFYMKQKRANVLAGAILYTFSSFTFYQIERHPQFAVGAIMLPLLLIGLEQVMKKKNVLFYSLMVALSLMSSYYFLYMNTFLMGVYVLLRIGTIYDTHKIRNFFQALWRIILSYLLGCAMSAVFFAPSIASFFQSARTSTGTKASLVQSLWFYGKDRVVYTFLSLIAPVRDYSYLTSLSVSAIVIPALILLFTRKWKEKFTLKLGFLLSVLFLLVPLFGYILSGFSTVNNRWSYGFVMVLAVIVMSEFQNLRRLTPVQYGIYFGIALIYAVCWLTENPSKKAYLAAFVLLLLFFLFLFVTQRKKEFPNWKWQRGIIGLLAFSVGFSGFFINDASCGNLIDQFQNMGSANQYFTTSRYQYLAEISDDSFYRTDTDMMYNNYNNTSVALGYRGISFYNSTISASTINYFTESESTGISAVNRTLSMDNRTSQEALACVKYFITTKGNSQNVPYGFVLDEDLSPEEEYDIYVNQYTLSVGYTYDSIISRSDYDALSALEKQEALLKSAVVSDEDMDDFSSLSTGDVSSQITSGTVEITGTDKGIKHKKKKKIFRVKNSAQIETTIVDGKEVEEDVSPRVHFSTTTKKGCEVYLRFKGLTCDQSVRSDVNVYCNGVEKRAIIRSDRDTYSLGTEDYLINLGYYDSEETITGELSFSHKGKYSYDAIEVYYVPMDSYEENISALNTDSLKNVTLSTNTVSGTVTASQDHLMTFSIPYHAGWTAYIDGKETKLYQVNTMYMGINLPAGSHKITLKYESPGVKAGAIVSLLAIALFIVLFILWRRKRRREKNVQQPTH